MTEIQLLILQEKIYALVENEFTINQVPLMIRKLIMDGVSNKITQEAFTSSIENEYKRILEQQQQESKEEEENDNSDSNS
jgi:hypothetical protein